MNCNSCSKAAQFQFPLDGQTFYVCSADCAVATFGVQRATFHRDRTVYIAFPELAIPPEFKNSILTDDEMPYAKDSVVAYIMNGLDFEMILLYEGQKIDWDTSILVVVLFQPFNAQYIVDDELTDDMKVVQANENFERVVQMVRNYSRVARHVAILRFFGTRNMDDFKDDEEQQLNAIKESIGANVDVETFYILYSIQVGRRMGTTTWVNFRYARTNRKRIENNMKKIIEKANETHDSNY